jgi:hypothetical protein
MRHGKVHAPRNTIEAGVAPGGQTAISPPAATEPPAAPSAPQVAEPGTAVESEPAPEALVPVVLDDVPESEHDVAVAV